MYKTQKIVIEDMTVSDNCPGERQTFTGGKSKLELPFTISFLSTGNYNVHIDEGQVVVTKTK